MPQLTMIMNGDGCWPDLLGMDVIHLGNDAPPVQIALLDQGMMSGHPSVTIRIDIGNNKAVVAETSARLFVAAARAVAARYPDLFKGN